MKTISIRLFLIFLMGAVLSCDKNEPVDNPDITNSTTIGILDIAFICRVQTIPASRLRKVNLCLAYTSDDLFRGIYFIQTNVSEAVTHYRFELPAGEYYYYASVICLSENDSCKYAGFSGQFGHIAAGGKVTVEAGKIATYTTQFH
ncbi:MAG: hypothetical protein PHY99_04520 [Bacteroidales bacterium]|nr:hypothetical protein [Bacteroidales bacterium]